VYKSGVERHTAPLRAEIAELRAQNAELKDKADKALSDAGVWQRGTVYAKGAGVTCGGTFWIAQTQTSAQPGHDKTWRLSFKNGRDTR